MRGGLSIAFNFSGGAGVSIGTISAISDNHNGNYTASFTGTTSGTASTISGTIGGSPVTSTLPSISVSPGAISLAQSILSVSAASVVAGFTSQITLTAKDAYSNSLTSGGLSVIFGTTGSGTSTGAISGTSDHANGIYTAVFTGVTAGTAISITASANGSNITSSSPSITVSTGSFSSARSTFTLASSSFLAGQNTIATLVLKDASNNVIADSSQASNLSFTILTTGSSSGSFGVISSVAGSPGYYQSTFTASTAGTANTLQASVAGSGNFNQTPSFSVQAGATSISVSTVVRSVASVAANGSASSLITVSLLDAYSNPVAGKTVTLTSNRSGSDTVSSSSGPSSASGVVTFSVSSIAAGTSTFTAIDATDSMTLVATPSVTFVAGAASPTLSSVSSSLTNVAANGISTSTLTVTLLDSNSNAIAGKTIALVSSRGSNDTISAASGTTTSLGVVTFTVKSIHAGTSVYSATDTTDSIALSNTASLNYLVGTLSQSGSTVLASPTSIADTGVSSTTVNVTLLDANSNPISGKTVSLVSNRNSGSTVDVISAPSGTSSASGVVTFTVTSSTAGSAVFSATDASDSLAITQTATVTVTLGLANSIAFTTGPVTPTGTDATQNLAISIYDSTGNLITTDSSSAVGLTAYSTTNCSGGSVASALSATSATALAGVARFNSLQVKKTSVKSLLGTLNAKTVCAAITVNPGAINSVAFTTGPISVTTDAAQTVALSEYDTNGNVLVTDLSSPITLAAYNSLDCSGAALSNSVLSSTSVTANLGVGTYSAFKFLKTTIRSMLGTSNGKTICAGSIAISAGAGASIAVTSGNSQSANDSTLLPLALVATVYDANLNATSGSTVTWANPAGSGTLSSCTTVSNGAGQVQCNYTLGQGTPSSNSVTASLGGSASVATFTETTTSVFFNYNWAANSSTLTLVTPGSNIDFNLNFCELTAASQIDASNVPAGFAGGTGSGVAFNTLSDNASTGISLSSPYACNASGSCSEFDVSWTPHFANLVGYWKLNEASGATASDSSGSGASGAISGSVALNQKGKMNSAMYFNGTTSSLDIGSPAAIDGVTQSSYSYSVWANASSFPSGANSSLSGGTLVGRMGYHDGIQAQPGGAIACIMYTSTPAGLGVYTNSITTGSWHHYIMVVDNVAKQLRCFVDGVEFPGSPKTYTGNPYNHAGKKYTIGISDPAAALTAGNYAEPFTGFIDEVGLFNVALTPTEVKTIYDRQVTSMQGSRAGYFTSRVMDAFSAGQSWTSLSWIPTLPFFKALPDAIGGAAQSESSSNYTSLASSTLMNGNVGLWHLDEAAGTTGAGTLVDSSGNGNHGTPNAGVSLGATGKFSSAASFNGTTGSISLGSFSLPWGNPAWVGSVSFWAKGSGSPIGNYRAGNSLNFSYISVAAGAGGFAFINADVGVAPYSHVINSTASIDTSVWNHYVITSDGAGHYQLSVNNVITNVTYTFAGSGSNYQTVTVGQFHNYTYGDGYWTGSMDEVGVWNRTLSASEIQLLYQRGASRIKFQVRSCTTLNCTAQADQWKGPDGTSNSYFSEIQNMTTQGAVPSGTVQTSLPNITLQSYATPVSPARWFQYRSILETDSTTASLMPELKSITVGPNHFDASSPSVVTTTGVSFFLLNNLVETLGSNACSSGIFYNLGVGASSATATWYWWNGSIWTPASGSASTATLAATLAPNLSTFASQVGTGTVYVKAFLKSNGSTRCELQNLRLDGHH